MYEKKQASVLTEFVPFICTSAIWGQSCFIIHLASCILPAPQQLGWGDRGGGPTTSTGSHRSQLVLGALIHLWRREIADGCFISCLLIWQEIFSFHSMLLINRKKNCYVKVIVMKKPFKDLISSPNPDLQLPQERISGMARPLPATTGCLRH